MHWLLFAVPFVVLLVLMVRYAPRKVKRTPLQRQLTQELGDTKSVDDATRAAVSRFDDLCRTSFSYEACTPALIAELEEARNAVETAVFEHSERSYSDPGTYDSILQQGAAICGVLEASLQDCRNRAGRPNLVTGPLRR